jgi:dihydroneopterin aldolase
MIGAGHDEDGPFRMVFPGESSQGSDAKRLFRILLTGITASGRHGANPGEKDQPQEFVVDLEVVVEVAHDDVASTADYDQLVAETRRVVTEESYDLIESLAQTIAGTLFEQDDDVMQVISTVHKPGAAAVLGIEDVAVEAMFPPAGDGTEP